MEKPVKKLLLLLIDQYDTFSDDFKKKFAYEMDNFFEDREFEKYMQEIHGEDYQGLDDDMPDAFGEWIEDIEFEQKLDYLYHFITKSLGVSSPSSK